MNKAEMIVKAFEKFSGLSWEEYGEPMTISNCFVAQIANNIYKIDCQDVSEVHCCYDRPDGKTLKYQFKIEVYNKLNGFIMDFKCDLFTAAELTIDDLDTLVYDFEAIDSLF